LRSTRRIIFALAVAASAAALSPASATARGSGDVPGAIDSWCSGGAQGRASCTAVFEKRGKFVLAFGSSRDSVGKYKVCARGPSGSRRCIRRATRETPNDTVGDSFAFGKFFPDKRDGRYDVSWFVDGRRVGPALHFVQR
jgi:hypothetical protein